MKSFSMGSVKNKKFAWTPVQLNEAVLSSGVEGLIGIEELTDYNLENDEIISPEKCYKKKDLKKTSLNKKKSINSDSKCKKIKPRTVAKEENKTATEDHDEVVNVGPNQRSEIDGSTSELHDLLPWYSLGVPHSLCKALVELGFNEPTEIQRLCIPPAIKGRRDILGAAETGSGKTLAFGIPIIHGILNNLETIATDEQEGGGSSSESDREDVENDGVGCVRVVNLGRVEESCSPAQKLWALVLTPTRELAVQIKNHLVAILKYTDIKVAVVVGGMSKEKQQRILNRRPHIVVATPGRLWELITEGEPHFNNLEDIRYLAIDETDRMTEVNHFPELRSLLEKINADPVKQKKRQNFVFSATLTLVHDLPLHTKLKSKKKHKKKEPALSPNDKLKKFIRILGITDPKIVDVTKKTGMAELLTESCIVCSIDQKDYYLFYFLQRHPGRTLVFCNSISCVRRLASLLSVLGLRPLPIHANMIQKQRLKNLDRFRDDEHSVMLATDVAARGLDIPHVEHVIHYQVPRTSESYVHRSGRTARANHEGLTLMLVETGEQKQYIRLMRTLNRDKELPRFPIVSSLMDAVKQRVNLARDIDRQQLEYKKATSKYNWVERAAQEMDLIVDDDDMPEKVNDRATSVIKRQIMAKQKQLKSLLNQSLSPRGMSYRYPSLNKTVSTAAGTFKSSQTAIEALRAASAEDEKKRKRPSKPFKPKKKKKVVSEST